MIPGMINNNVHKNCSFQICISFYIKLSLLFKYILYYVSYIVNNYISQKVFINFFIILHSLNGKTIMVIPSKKLYQTFSQQMA